MWPWMKDKRFSVGIDIVNIPHFISIIELNNLKSRLFSEAELNLPNQSLAGNFAIKESIVKAFGGYPLYPFSKIEVLRDSRGAPYLRAESLKEKKLISRVLSLSISHDVDYCVGVVIVK